MKNIRDNMRYLQLLAKEFQNVPRVTTEIINLEAIMHLPKATEHFLADLHGETDAFQHVLRLKKVLVELLCAFMRSMPQVA